jgi:hypothetical protein
MDERARMSAQLALLAKTESAYLPWLLAGLGVHLR